MNYVQAHTGDNFISFKELNGLNFLRKVFSSVLYHILHSVLLELYTESVNFQCPLIITQMIARFEIGDDSVSFANGISDRPIKRVLIP